MTLHVIRCILPAALVVCVTTLGACVPAGSQRVGDLQIDEPWARATPAGGSVSAGFLVVRNLGNRNDRLVSVSSSAVARVEIHEARNEHGMMKMRPLPDGMDIPAGAEVSLQPGGYHLMILEPRQPFVGGDVVVATLHFQQAGDVEVAFRVRGAGAAAERAHHH